ncbi:plant virulence effector HPE1-like domain-containing protein [Mycoplana dimorpha]|uniref:NlpE-like protein n=1 Tax=Mycoplana dimorpha TaxID=28320 RepID=A0A2T5BHG2_MYCDI|nr:plant virulence effector HPE1-like domain-containing protein [Mycoplana dimorpha]PTM98437.1 hypothetical protein C7449_101100 [Mycoplana dimorpha]
MRLLLPTIACGLLATPVLASSIEPVTSAGAKGQGSIQAISCTGCPALKETKQKATYVVPDIAPGTQKVEIREIEGERKIFRSEAWLGGSPVVFVSRAPETVDTETAEKPGDPATAVDPDTLTGALDVKAAAPAASTETGGSRQLDPSTFELRLD